MIINDDVLDRLQKLSMIKIDDTMRSFFKEELSDIVTKMQALNEIDTSLVDDTGCTATPLRDDIPVKSDVKDALFDSDSDGFFVVKKIL